ncbi:hypothetical protein Gpo141_00009056 [Globisporangium polare]
MTLFEDHIVEGDTMVGAIQALTLPEEEADTSDDMPELTSVIPGSRAAVNLELSNYASCRESDPLRPRDPANKLVHETKLENYKKEFEHKKKRAITDKHRKLSEARCTTIWNGTGSRVS